MNVEIHVYGVIIKPGDPNKVLLVFNEGNQIKPPGWGLPGGGRYRRGEGIKKALLREIEEETGIPSPRIAILRELEYARKRKMGDGIVEIRARAFLCRTDDDGDPNWKVEGEIFRHEWFPFHSTFPPGLILPTVLYQWHRRVLVDGLGRINPTLRKLIEHHFQQIRRSA